MIESALFDDVVSRLDEPVQPMPPAEAGQERAEAVALMPEIVASMPVSAVTENPTNGADFRNDVSRALNRVLANRPSLRPRAPVILDMLIEEMAGLGPLEALFRDPEVTDILVNRWDRIYAEREGKLSPAGISFLNESHLINLVHRIVARAGRRVDQASPTVDARLPDGSRINVILPPLSLDGPVLSVRRHSTRNYAMQELIDTGSIPGAVAGLLALAVRARLNVIVSGGAGAGKTTLLNAMSAFIRERERVVTIEDTAELQLRQHHVVRLETRPAGLEGIGEVTQRHLVRQSLRMRPDRVIVGEVRGPEAWDMLTAMNTGSQGSLSTLHANRSGDALLRIEGLVALAHPYLGIAAIRSQIASAVNLIVQVERLSDGRRRLTELTEITGMKGDAILTRPLYRFRSFGADPDGNINGEDEYGEPSPALSAIVRQFGLTMALDAILTAPALT